MLGGSSRGGSPVVGRRVRSPEPIESEWGERAGRVRGAYSLGGVSNNRRHPTLIRHTPGSGRPVYAAMLLTLRSRKMLIDRSLSFRRRLGVTADHAQYKWWALSCTSLGMLLATVNSGTLIIALPELGRSLGTSVLQLVWVILAYMISSTVLVLTAGRLSDLFDRKRAYIGGFVVFALASLGAGFSHDATQLILWRIAQGVGAAFLFANAAALVTDAFPKRQL